MLIYAPYLFVQDTEGSTSDYTGFSEMLAPSATWKTKFLPQQSWLRILKKADWMTRLFGPISRRLTLARSSAELMQSLAATLASRFPLQESGEEQKTPGTCGHTLQESLTLFGQESVSLKTSGGTFDWDCPKCLANSESLATELGRVYSQRRKSAPRTDESGSLSWPTHRAGKPGGESEANFMLRKSQGKQATPPLALAVLMMWPTASARDYKDTPGMAQEAFDTSGKFRNRIDQLARAVYWRTPSASDGEGGAFDMEKARRLGMKPKLKLRDHVLDGLRALARHSTTGKNREQLTENSIPPGSPS